MDFLDFPPFWITFKLLYCTYTEAWGGKKRDPDPEDKSVGDVDPRLNEDWTEEIGNIFWMEIQVVKAGSNEQ